LNTLFSEKIGVSVEIGDLAAFKKHVFFKPKSCTYSCHLLPVPGTVRNKPRKGSLCTMYQLQRTPHTENSQTQMVVVGVITHTLKYLVPIFGVAKRHLLEGRFA
jgi:hypothetical protein